MSDRKDKKREAPISYRPPKDLRDEFHSHVQKSGLSTTAFITKAVFNEAPPRQSRRPSIEEKLLARLLNEAVKIHHELHENSQAGCDTASNTQLMEEAVQALTEIRAALLKGMGRNP
jgi:hypothetical protein